MNTLSKKPSNSFLDGVNPKVILSFLLIIIAGVLYYSFPPDPTEPTHLVWETQIGQLGVGSPRLADVNKDGVLDIFIGSGFEWSEDGDSAMQLIDGATGQSIWRVETPKSAYGTPVLIDINNDGVVDVTASGRFSDFYMMDGRTGKILWKVSEVNPNVALLPCNFNSPVFIRDQDGDGLDDLMVIQSGLADDSVHLRLYDEKTGQVLVDRYSRQSIEKSIADFLKTTTDQTLILRICQGEVCEVKSVDRSIFERYTFDVFMSKIFFNQEGPGGQVYVISSKSGQILRQFPVPFGRESWSV
ncbi:MAG: hypothetical protein VW397_03985, partial [Candidatus Margulisiibacteriota bacterium]